MPQFSMYQDYNSPLSFQSICYVSKTSDYFGFKQVVFHFICIWCHYVTFRLVSLNLFCAYLWCFNVVIKVDCMNEYLANLENTDQCQRQFGYRQCKVGMNPNHSCSNKIQIFLSTYLSSPCTSSMISSLNILHLASFFLLPLSSLHTKIEWHYGHSRSRALIWCLFR